MTCKFHLRELIAEKQRTPFSSHHGEGHEGRKIRKRIILRCPISGCAIVANFYDAEKKEPRRCGRCRKVILIFSGHLCAHCQTKYQRSLRRTG